MHSKYLKAVTTEIIYFIYELILICSFLDFQNISHQSSVNKLHQADCSLKKKHSLKPDENAQNCVKMPIFVA